MKQALSLVSLAWTLISNSTLSGRTGLRTDNFRFTSLPLQINTVLSMRNLYFSQAFSAVHFSPLILRVCAFNGNLDLESHAPAQLIDCHNIKGKINAPKDGFIMKQCTVSQKEFETLAIQGAKSTEISDTTFVSLTHTRQIQIKDTEIAKINECNFSRSENGAVSGTNSDIYIYKCVFYDLNADSGAGIYLDGKSINIKLCTFIDCKAELYGGAIFIKNGEALVSHSTFQRNTANIGKSIYSNLNSKIQNCVFESKENDEVYGIKLIINCQFDMKINSKRMKYAPPTGPIVAVTASQSPFATPTPKQTPVATPSPEKIVNGPDVPLTQPPSQYITTILIVTVIAAFVVIAVLIAVVVIVKKKQKANKIYPGDDETEVFPEPDPLPVVKVKSIYEINTVIP